MAFNDYETIAQVPTTNGIISSIWKKTLSKLPI